MFFYEVEGHIKIELIWTRKKFQAKKSLTRLLHEALQLSYLLSFDCGII